VSLETDVVAVLQAQCPRVFPASAPVNTQRPFVTWEHIGGDPLRYMEGSAAPQRLALLQVNTWANTKAEAMTLALAIEDALCVASAITARPNGAARGDHSDEVEPALYGALQEFEVLGTR
jgi:hypothetical protein